MGSPMRPLALLTLPLLSLLAHAADAPFRRRYAQALMADVEFAALLKRHVLL